MAVRPGTAKVRGSHEQVNRESGNEQGGDINNASAVAGPFPTGTRRETRDRDRQGG